MPLRSFIEERRELGASVFRAAHPFQSPPQDAHGGLFQRHHYEHPRDVDQLLRAQVSDHSSSDKDIR